MTDWMREALNFVTGPLLAWHTGAHRQWQEETAASMDLIEPRVLRVLYLLAAQQRRGNAKIRYE